MIEELKLVASSTEVLCVKTDSLLGYLRTVI